jgi:ABC-type bacteriocin/lantibiotic exporter with double-glycine peptidase domain
MNIFLFIVTKFIEEEKWNTGILVAICFLLNIIQANVLSFVTASIVQSVENKEPKSVYFFYYIFIGVTLLALGLYLWYIHLESTLMTKMREWIKLFLMKILLFRNNDNFTETNTTKYYSIINRMSRIAHLLFSDIISFVLPNAVFLIIIVGFFIYKDFAYGLGFMLANIFIFIYLYFQIYNLLEKDEAYEASIIRSDGHLMEILNHMDKIIYRGKTAEELEDYSSTLQSGIDIAYDFYTSSNIQGGLLLFITTIIMFVSFGYLIHRVINKKLEITIFITFFTILLLYREKMQIVFNQLPNYIELIGRTNSVYAYFKDTQETVLEDQKMVLYDSSPNLKFDTIQYKHVDFQYPGTDKLVMRDFNIEIKTNNKIIGITGPSGKGKSTFVKLLLRLYAPTGGAIYVDGVDLSTVDPDYIRSNVIYVNQNSKLFNKQVIDNLTYGCADGECDALLDKMMEYPKIKALFEHIKMDKESGSLGENLSGGQRQVINMINGMIHPGKILILDEPTNALDGELKQEVLRMIADARKYKKCIFIITHDRDVYSLFSEKIEI